MQYFMRFAICEFAGTELYRLCLELPQTRTQRLHRMCLSSMSIGSKALKNLQTSCISWTETTRCTANSSKRSDILKFLPFEKAAGTCFAHSVSWHIMQTWKISIFLFLMWNTGGHRNFRIRVLEAVVGSLH